MKKPLVTVALAVLLVFCTAGFLGFKYLRIEECDVEGNSVVEDAAIVKMSGVESGMHVLELDLDQAKHNIEKDPYLHVRDISYVFPSKLAITVEESRRDALIQFADTSVYIDRNGYVLAIVEKEPEADQLRVRGLSVSGFNPGEKVGVSDKFQLEVLCDVLNTLYDSNQRNWYSVVDISDAININLLTYDSTIVRLGQAEDLGEKLRRVSIVLDKLKEMGYKEGVVDARSYRNIAYQPGAKDADELFDANIGNVEENDSEQSQDIGVDEIIDSDAENDMTMSEGPDQDHEINIPDEND